MPCDIQIILCLHTTRASCKKAHSSLGHPILSTLWFPVIVPLNIRFPNSFNDFTFYSLPTSIGSRLGEVWHYSQALHSSPHWISRTVIREPVTSMAWPSRSHALHAIGFMNTWEGQSVFVFHSAFSQQHDALPHPLKAYPPFKIFSPTLPAMPADRCCMKSWYACPFTGWHLGNFRNTVRPLSIL